MKKKFLLGLGLLLFLRSLSYSQNPGDVVINEIMYAPTPAANEWFELYNNTAAPFNMANWKWKDATATLRIITTQNINLPANGFAVVCQDSTAFRTAFPGFTGILLQPSNGWSSLNNTGTENLVIFKADTTIADSIQFTNSWGGGSGNRSLERISSTAPTNQQSNWGTSTAALGATPGLRNSISPLANDLALNILSFSTNNPVIGTNLQITANVKNRGTNAANSFNVSFYDDYNDDGNPAPNELISTVNSSAPLSAGDSVNLNTSKIMDSLGVRQFIAVVNFSGDEDTSNNKRTGTVTVVNTSSFDSLVINEIMYSPTPSSNEWFEIYNKTSNAVNLANWKWKDATATVNTITTQAITIPANGFAVICQDSAAVKSAYPNNTGIYIQTGWSSLNNTGDNIVLFNSAGTVIDSITFTSGWGGSTNNRSLERISYTAPTNQQSNWGTCIAVIGATPNKINSLVPKPNDLALNKITFSRTLPALGDTLGIIAQVKNRGLNPATLYTVSFYDDYNKDSIAAPNELKATINSPGSLNTGDSVNITYSQILDSAGLRQFIAVVNYSADEDTSNNKYTASIEVSGGSTAGRVIINEIMYDFPDGECEWVEIYNNTDSVVNLKNWKISDNSLTQVNITSNDFFVNPQSYAVISQSSAIFANHPSIDSSKVIIMSSFPSLNNAGDAVIIYKINGSVSDRVDYLPDWGGDNSSLERIDINGVSNDSSNWASSIACERSTPTIINSITSAVHYQRNDLVINEIMAAPLTGQPEYIELYNPTNQNINIAGWLYTETGGSKGLSDTCSAIIKPGMYAVIAADTNIYNAFPYLRTPDSTQRVFIAGSLGLNNEGDLVQIADVFKTVVDSVFYSDNWYNPNLPGSGRSLEKLNPGFNGNDGRNWSSCTFPNGGSPGLKNSIYTGSVISTGEITVSPNPFSPDGDGYEDFTVISYKLQNTVSQVRMKIFDVKGRLVKTIMNNQTSGSQGQVVFDGLDEEKRKLRLGIYIIFLEALNDQNGVVETIKSTLVVGAKL
ncbi:MAG: hypothetical protein UZ05_CHB002000201 [Chlorobi bacterium OLB5]|nr:MAG: hypothetical protein UZ05_CHB002000201 [Chlorobi bacterium OLB5]